MSRKIKLIWIFSGPDAEGTAKHHEIHIREFLVKNNFSELITGVDYQNEIYWSAYLIVDEKDMIFFRDRLKPHKGEIAED
jgi:hypothetical protein